VDPGFGAASGVEHGAGGDEGVQSSGLDGGSTVSTGGAAWVCARCETPSATGIGCTFEGHLFCVACTCACAAFPLPYAGSAGAILQRHESREGALVGCCDRCHSLWNKSDSFDPCSRCRGHLILPFLEQGRLYCCYCKKLAGNDPSDQGVWKVEPTTQEEPLDRALGAEPLDGALGAELAGAVGPSDLAAELWVQAEHLGGGASGTENGSDEVEHFGGALGTESGDAERTSGWAELNAAAFEHVIAEGPSGWALKLSAAAAGLTEGAGGAGGAAD
jgi:hypothetical protein